MKRCCRWVRVVWIFRPPISIAIIIALLSHYGNIPKRGMSILWRSREKYIRPGENGPKSSVKPICSTLTRSPVEVLWSLFSRELFILGERLQALQNTPWIPRTYDIMSIVVQTLCVQDYRISVLTSRRQVNGWYGSFEYSPHVQCKARIAALLHVYWVKHFFTVA